MSFDRVLLIKPVTKASLTSCFLCETEPVTLQLILASDYLQLFTTSVEKQLEKLREMLKGGCRAGSNKPAGEPASYTGPL